MKKIIIFTAPSGAGKTTIVKHLLGKFPQLDFSISATSRTKRSHEIHGIDYYFLSSEEFSDHIQRNDFLEFEEVYNKQFYGTLKSELQRLWNLGKTIVFDVDVKGATTIKQLYPNESLSVFIKPPSKEILEERLQIRQTETSESLSKRIEKAEEELKYENNFDIVIINDKLDEALKEAEQKVQYFLSI